MTPRPSLIVVALIIANLLCTIYLIAQVRELTAGSATAVTTCYHPVGNQNAAYPCQIGG